MDQLRKLIKTYRFGGSYQGKQPKTLISLITLITFNNITQTFIHISQRWSVKSRINFCNFRWKYVSEISVI